MIRGADLLEASEPETRPLQSVQRTAISGFGISVPEKILTNRDLEKRVETSDEWIVTRTGIRERRIGNAETSTSDLCIQAAKKALSRASLPAEELDLILVCTVTPDRTVPATACIVQDRLGAKKAAGFDINGGCTGFMYGLATGSQFISTRMYRNVLVIGADMLSRIVDWQDRSTCILFGDGAGAVVLQPSPNEASGLLDFHLGTDGSGAELLRVDAGGSRNPTTQETVAREQHFLRMEGRPVFKFAVHAILDGVNTLLHRNHLSVEDIDCFLFHQANIRILENAAKQLKIPMEKIFTNVERYGNTSSASIPLAFTEALEDKKFKRGSYVILVGFGAGLTWASALMRW